MGILWVQYVEHSTYFMTQNLVLPGSHPVVFTRTANSNNQHCMYHHLRYSRAWTGNRKINIPTLAIWVIQAFIHQHCPIIHCYGVVPSLCSGLHVQMFRVGRVGSLSCALSDCCVSESFLTFSRLSLIKSRRKQSVDPRL